MRARGREGCGGGSEGRTECMPDVALCTLAACSMLFPASSCAADQHHPGPRPAGQQLQAAPQGRQRGCAWRRAGSRGEWWRPRGAPEEAFPVWSWHRGVVHRGAAPYDVRQPVKPRLASAGGGSGSGGGVERDGGRGRRRGEMRCPPAGVDERDTGRMGRGGGRRRSWRRSSRSRSLSLSRSLGVFFLILCFPVSFACVQPRRL